MGLISFAKSVGRKVGMFGGQKAAANEAAQEVAKQALAASQAAGDAAQKAALSHQALAADIHAAILSHGLEIQGLAVRFDGENAHLSGTAPSQMVKEKAILVAGNTENVGGVDADGMSVVAPEPPAIYHTVVSGDSLSKISLANYGSMQLFDHIFEANKPMLEHPDRIYPGQVLRIPRQSAHLHTVKAGETLGSIAKFHYGNAKRYTDIFAANSATMPNADTVTVGQQIRIPLAGPAVDASAATV